MPTERPTHARQDADTPATPTFREDEGEAGIIVPKPGGGDILLTRRHFLYGAIGAGIVVAAGAGIGAGMQTLSQRDTASFNTLTVPEDAVFASTDLTAIGDADSMIRLAGDWQVPYGSLVWANNDSLAACLVPTDGGSPLTQASLLSLSSGQSSTVLTGAVGLGDGFEIYDVRAVPGGMVWTEANILEGIWRVYSATLSNSLEPGQPVLAEEGSTDWDTPTIAAVGGYAFWQRLPKADGAKSSSASVVRRVAFGQNQVEDILSSNGRMASALHGGQDCVVACPRAAGSSSRYKLVRIDAESGQISDELVLPSSMRPYTAGYGETGFFFSFEGIYQTGGGIANLGTYLPTVAVSPVADDAGNANYSDVPWFRHAQSPTVAPAWCDGLLLAKGNYNVVAIDLGAKSYCILDLKSGAPKFGDYIASSGMGKTAVTYANIDYTSIDGESSQYCSVRVWTRA